MSDSGVNVVVVASVSDVRGVEDVLLTSHEGDSEGLGCMAPSSALTGAVMYWENDLSPDSVPCDAGVAGVSSCEAATPPLVLRVFAAADFFAAAARPLLPMLSRRELSESAEGFLF